MGIFKRLLGDPNKKVLNELQKIVEQINAHEVDIQALSDEELANQTIVFKKELKDGKTMNDILPRAFATVREVSKRIMKMRHFDVQMMGGIVLHRGQIAEMRTGEGKTLTSTLPMYLNALAGKGVHVITVNDYLAARDAVWMGEIFDFLGLTIGCIQGQNTSFVYDKTHIVNQEQKDEIHDTQGSFNIVHDYLKPSTRTEAYAADITYGTNNEFGFDYLRDNMAQKIEHLAQRDLAYAIIDEVDSILIDEARTPLIISAPAADATNLYGKFSVLVRTLKEQEDYNIDEKMRSATLTDEGINKLEKSLGVDNIYVSGGIQMVHHIEQALKAETLFKRDKDYVVNDGEIVIVDEFTGRMMPGRRYSEGLHQAIEAKEGVEVQKESQTLATITFQNYFRLYKKLSGMTGTAATEAEEFSNIYKLETVVISTNKTIARIDLSDKVYKTEKGKIMDLVKNVKELSRQGKPVLIGTVSIEKNELIASLLEKAGVPCNVLNAKQHEKEASFVAQAGRKGAVTVATNMAGRGVDISLGGNPCTPEEAQEVKDLGGLHVFGTERHESRRIDNQLRGRSGRQGDSGFSQFYISMDDDVMRIFGSDKMKVVMDKLGLPDDMPIENKFISKSIESAQKRVEGNNFDIRKHVLEYDDVLNKHRTTIYKNRHSILFADDSKDLITEMIQHEIEQVVSFHTAQEHITDWNIKEILEVASTIFSLSQEKKDEIIKFVEQNTAAKTAVELRTYIIEELEKPAYKAYELIEQQVIEATGSADSMRQIEKNILLRTYDTLWVEHLDAMHHLRIGIGLRGYGQRDPLVEYKKEAFSRFNELQNLIQRQVVYSIYKITFNQDIQRKSVLEQKNIQMSGGEQSEQFSSMKSDPYKNSRRKESLVRIKEVDEQGNKIGRNDPCHCGSNKKYKKCHGA